MTKIFGPAAENFLSARGISGEVAARFEIYTGSSRNGEVIADAKGSIIVFPFIDHGRVVNEKYRSPPKKFWQRPNGRRTFWNSDALDDPALAEGRMPLIITEGIEDALSAIESGFPLTVSVPDGAPAAKADTDDDQKLDPQAERSGKFEFLWNNRERLKLIKRFVIATDNDEPGKTLAAELVRRLSAARCAFISYPQGCKDLNEVLLQYDSSSVAAVLNDAKPYPVRGLYRLSEYPELAKLTTFAPGFDQFFDADVDGANAYLRVFFGEFMVVTGIPGHGKSSWVLALIHNLALRYQWRAVMFSPEMPTVPHLRDKLRKLRLGRKVIELDRDEVKDCDRWINDMVLFIDHDPAGQFEAEFNLDWILDRATDAVLRDGVRVLVIDPWNEIEHAKRKDETMTEYIGRSIRSIRRWAQQYEVLAIVVAHPTKEVGREGKSRVPSLYDIDGAAHWFNKADHGIVISTVDEAPNVTSVYVRKVRFDETGRKGKHSFKFDPSNGRYQPLDAS